jgi:cell pole-organizing protein PopZ
MPKPGQAQDQAMDEILASIRRIIQDEDVRKSGVREAMTRLDTQAPREGAAAGSADRRDAGETDSASGRGPLQSGAPPAKASTGRPAEKDNVVELAMAQPTEPTKPVEQPAAEAPPARPEPPVRRPVEMRPAPPAMPHAQPRPLLSPRSDAAVASAFQQLTTKMLAGSARSMDELVEDMLRPMLRSWLDTNLPPLVERLVREEIERVSRGR